MSKRRYSRKAKNPNSVRKIVKNILDKTIETKFTTYNPFSTSISTRALGSQIDRSLNSMGRGTGPKTRIGDKIITTGYYGKFYIENADLTNTMRVIVYRPKNQSVLMTSASVENHTDIDLSQYIVYEDFYVHTSQQGPAVTSFTLSRKFKKGIVGEFSGSNATDMKNGELLLYIVSDSGVVVHPQLNGHFRCFYKDA